MPLRSRVCMHAVACIFVHMSCSSLAQAQQDPRQILAGVIQQLQTGTPNPQWYGQQLWFLIAQQTGNTGVYPALVQLGPLTNATVTQTVQLPAGPVYAITAQHQNGTSTWNLGISNFTNRIEYANFNVGSSPQPLPSPNPQPSPPPTSPGPAGSPSSSPACQKFPNLC